MPMKIGDLHKRNLIGANAIVNFGFNGEQSLKTNGSQVYFLDSGTRCDRGQGAPGTGELMLDRDGDRVVISGRISCQAKDESPGMRTISGWFQY